MNRSGTATFVLHTHLPYCRLAGNWPHGEEWIHEALLECYLPLIAAFRRLSSEVAGSIGVTINMTPILTEQLADPLVLDHFRTYLDDRLGRAEADVERFRSAGGLRAETARFHRDRFAAMHDLFEHGLHGDFVGALGELEAGGHLEIATSAATHGYLPLLGDDAAVEFQVAAGVQSHLRHFGRAPRSFWLRARSVGRVKASDGPHLRPSATSLYPPGGEEKRFDGQRDDAQRVPRAGSIRDIGARACRRIEDRTTTRSWWRRDDATTDVRGQAST